MGRLGRTRKYWEQAEARSASVPHRAEPSVARAARVVAFDPTTGRPWNGAHHVVPAALMVELAHESRLDVSGSDRRTRVTLRDPTPLGDPELDDALKLIGSPLFGRTPKVTRLIGYLPSTQQLLDRLVREGVLVDESRRRLGLFTTRRYVPTPAAGRDAMVARLRSALVGASVPDERTALVLASLVGIHLKVVVPKADLREARRRAQDVVALIGDGEQAIVSAAWSAINATDD